MGFFENLRIKLRIRELIADKRAALDGYMIIGDGSEKARSEYLTKIDAEIADLEKSMPK